MPKPAKKTAARRPVTPAAKPSAKVGHQIAELEQSVLKFWEQNRSFEKSVEQRPTDQQYVFYDGPPFATGLPHYGHIVASLMKDMVPRHWTMRGRRVVRTWGWDCHGLPIENLIEKDLHLDSKRAIEEYGVAKFNEACRAKVLEYADEWKRIIPRTGRWVDMEHAYKTMDRSYMESVWWVFKQLWDRGLVYEGHKSMHICPRCVTPISNFEVSWGYKTIKDLSVVARFRLTENPALAALELSGPVFMLAWTTTPWTLPGNTLLAVGPKVEYAAVEHEGATYILAAALVAAVFGDRPYQEIRRFSAEQLVGLLYQPLFPYFADTANAFRVVTGDFVSTEEGTGVVHIAPAFGEDDYQLGQREGVPLVQHVTMEGEFTPAVTDFAGQKVKPKEDHTAADVQIIKWLAAHDALFSKQKYEHSYPHCWRCDTPLLNYAAASWFVKVTAIRDQLVANNQPISWVPEHIKDGRFGKWLAGARDWSISRSRYWGTPLPLWRADDGEILCIGSAAELEELSGSTVADLHKHFVDEIVIERAGKQFRRVPEVLDTWFDSGSMPYAHLNYPFANTTQFENGFPAEFIAEGQDQTRGWFYVLHVLATALTSVEPVAIPSAKHSPAFRHVVVNGIVLAEDGKKMSKRLQNYPDPVELIDRYGADAMRYYLATSPVMEAENLNFSEQDVAEIYRKYTNTLLNVLAFYELFADQATTAGHPPQPVTDPAALTNVLDQWILSRLESVRAEITEGYDQYRLRQAARPLLDFVQELSTWYVRRSRDRLKGTAAADQAAALDTLHTVLRTVALLAAPVTPFVTEHLYQRLRQTSDPESVHHEDWPAAQPVWHRPDVEALMAATRSAVERGLALRAASGVKVRQPLLSFTVAGDPLPEPYQALLQDELNVRAIQFGSADALDTSLTDELRREGALRELVRQTNAMRKRAGLTLNDRVRLTIQTESPLLRTVLDHHQAEYVQAVLADAVELASEPQPNELSVDGEALTLTLWPTPTKPKG